MVHAHTLSEGRSGRSLAAEKSIHNLYDCKMGKIVHSLELDRVYPARVYVKCVG